MAEIGVIRREVEDAANAIISASVRGLDLLERAERGEKAAFDGLEDILCAILQACAFQDLTGQRLDRLCFETLAHLDTHLPPDRPGDRGVGADRDDAGRRFAGAPAGR